jgi:small subunit ribosomal protein S4
MVNGKKMNIPSYTVKLEDVVELKHEKLAPAEILVKIPVWLAKDGVKCIVLSEPSREDIDEGIKENLIIEYYSR